MPAASARPVSTEPRSAAGRERLGAYGFTFDGVVEARSLFPTPASWPVFRVERVVEQPAPDRAEPRAPVIELAPDRAALDLGATGRLVLERETATATYHTTSVLDDEALAHPYLGWTGAYAAWWYGRLAFHAGAFLLDGRAWGVLGDKEHGKSTLLALLHQSGVEVLTDDVLVLEQERCFAGPRSLDLRPASAERVEIPGAQVLEARNGTRRRLLLPLVEAEVALAGWIFLSWGDEIGIERVPPATRLTRLGDHRVVRTVHDDPVELLELAARPAWELHRPRSWDSLRETADRLLGTIAA
jgi:hypothetical protein